MSYKDTIPVRQGEELNHKQLETYLRGYVEELEAHSLEIEQFPSGHSNLTYALKAGPWEAVLRRPPLGPVAPKAHDMKREYHILKELHPLFPVAPKPIVFCEEEDVIGRPFFIMERRRGIVIDTEFPSNIEVTPEICRSISETMINTLVDLHSVDYRSTRLVEMSRPEGFLERQVHGWIGRYHKAKTDEVKGVEELTNWLANNIPTSPDPSVIHYDFKLNNSMFAHDDITKIVGLFDWEMTTVGDPLADLGVALGYWIEDSDPDLLKIGFGKPPVTILPGFMTRSEMVEAYAKRSGRDVSDVHYYLTFAYFKLAVIAQQIYYRYKKGQTNDARFSKFNYTVASLIHHGLTVSKEPF
ncbi:phosphotransferase family protein [Alkalihalobacterium sp. APHAB7]|uniref:phosphotransferase family protein n=1 Tax=Alkalihalobacterium sp. APHAB7 TaxID=3402081 RepID=UPI003AAA8C56